MKVILIAALSADGFIAKDTDHAATWTSGADKALFVKITKAAGVIIMGSTTFKTIGRALPGRRNIVLSHHQSVHPDVETTNEQPAVLLSRLVKEGYGEAVIIGGGQVYSLFMKAGLINELVLTVEPKLFGQGITLFNSPLVVELKLLTTERLGDNSVMLRYKVER